MSDKEPQSNITTFGAALKRVRSERNFSHADVADRAAVSRKTISSWENNEAIPSTHHLKRLYGTFPTLRFFTDLLPSVTKAALSENARQVISDVEATPQELKDVWLPPQPEKGERIPEALQDRPLPNTFHEALRAIRLSEGLSIEELATLLGITGQSVSAWEHGKTLPVEEHYTKLCDLFPPLTGLSKPVFRAVEKPNGGKGLTKPSPVTSAAPLALFQAEKSTMSVTPVTSVEPPAVVPLSTKAPSKVENFSQSLAEAGIAYAQALQAKHQQEALIEDLKKRLSEAQEGLEPLQMKVEGAHNKLLKLANQQ